MGIEDLIRFLLYLVIGGLIIYVVYWIVGMTTLSPQLKNIITLVISIVVIVWLVLSFLPAIRGVTT